MKFTQTLMEHTMRTLTESGSDIFVEVDGHPHVRFDEIAVYMGFGGTCFELRYKGIPLLREGNVSAWRKEGVVTTGVQGTHRIEIGSK